MANLFRCGECGKFISRKDYEAVIYYYPSTNYSMNVPEPGYICGKCWNGMGKDAREEKKKESPYEVNYLFNKGG